MENRGRDGKTGTDTELPDAEALDGDEVEEEEARESRGEATPAAGSEVGEATGPGEDVDAEADLTRNVDELREALDSLNDRHLRLAAEFDNYRRRSQIQLGESGVRAQASLVERLLDVLDDFGRVTSIDPESATVESVLEGVTLVERKLHQLLEGAGLEEVDPVGEPFDPNVMEAMAASPAKSEDEDDVVGQVFQKGFRFRGHLVRPARVSVLKFE